jgi:guanylate kinase
MLFQTNQQFYFITGTMASGKDRVLKELAKVVSFYLVTSTTSRPKRDGEVEKNPYYFVDQKTFEKIIKQNGFIEWNKKYNHYYGVTKKELKKALASSFKKIIIRTDENGIESFKKIFPDAITIFLLPPSLEEIKKRILNRGNLDKNLVKERLAEAKRQIEAKNKFDYTIINKEINQTVKEFLQIISK